MIHLVYPHRPRISAPDVIGDTLLRQLGRDHEVVAHDFDRTYRIDPMPGDILIGHAHPVPWTVFRRSARRSGWARRILLEPFNADWQQIGFVDQVIDDCDLFLAITGLHWFRHCSEPTARWKPKMVHVDLAVDRAVFPKLRQTVAPKGQRRFLYVGNDHPGKNLPYLDAIAAAWRGGTIDWAGRGQPLPHVRSLGFVDFASASGQELVSAYDFLITVGHADANPTTILEAISWGLSPICTPTSGYIDEPAIVNVPGNNVAGVCAILDELQRADAATILARRAVGAERLMAHFNWDRFVGQVCDAIASNASPVLSPRAPSSPPPPRTSAATMGKLAARNLLYSFERRWPGLGIDSPALTQVRNWMRR